MSAMSHRERVLTALSHQEPDRVPLDLWGSATTLNDGIYMRLKQALGIEGDVAPWRQGHTGNYYDERVLEKLDVDFRHVWLKSRSDVKTKVNPDGSYVDEWGVTWQPEAGFVAVVTNPLNGAELDDLKSYPWPVARAPGRTDGLKERTQQLRESTDYAVEARSATSLGLFEYCYNLRGTEEFMIDMMTNKKFAAALVDRVTQFEFELVNYYLDAVGEYIDILCWAEDFGHQTGLLISPALYREFFKPRHAEIIASVKRKAPHVKFQFHSCGAIRPIIPEFIDIGVDILQSIQPRAKGMDSAELKREFGKQLTFHGAIDIQLALPGSLEDIDKEVRKRIAALAPGGGYILAPSNNVQDDTPVENVIHMYQVAKTYGHYPIWA